MEAWMENLFLGILAAVVVSGSAFLWRLVMKWFSHTPTSGEVGSSGDQPQADALRSDVEVGPILNGGEAKDHVPSGVAANGSKIPRHDDGGLQRGRITEEMDDGLQIHGESRL